MLINKVVMAEVVLCVDGVMVDVTVSNDVATAPPAAASPVVKAEEVSMINRSIVLTMGVLVVLVLAMDAVAIEVNKMWADMAPTAHALDVSSMLLKDAFLVLDDVMPPVGAPMQMVHAPNLTPVDMDQTR